MSKKTKGKILMDYVQTLSKTKVYNWSISEARMASTWTKAQSKDINEMKSAILAEAIKTLDNKFETKFDKIIDILQEIRSDIKDIKNTPTMQRELKRA